jgi:D-sedoheptulose 7-phosphate isomerase
MAETIASTWARALAERSNLLAALGRSALDLQLARLSDWIVEAAASGRRVLLFGNGGSAATAQHAAAELVGRYETERAPIAAVALTTDTSILTAVANDYGFDRLFERQIEGLAHRGDVAVALSTSGRSPNVLRGLRAARRCGARTAALLGRNGGPARRLADLALVVPATRTSVIQEAHELLIHVLCEEVERRVALRRRRRGPKA